MIERLLFKNVLERINRGKIIMMLGARQVGKTTLARQITEKVDLKTLWLNGDEPDVRELLSNVTSSRLKAIIGNHKLLVIDEAQRIANIGITLKLIADNLKNIKVLVTGSSSLELASLIKEPLTGRKYEFFLYPLSFNEMINHTNQLEESRLLEHRLIYGYYPEIVTTAGEEKELLSLLSDSYLYKDLLTLGHIKKSALLEKLLQALALQLGNQVSYNELGRLVGADNATIERYLDLLEKAFIIFRLPSLSRNLRNELKKSRKVYFYDNGIRNAIIKSFNPLAIRNDIGPLWENFLISERTKRNHYAGYWVNRWFWRTLSQQEIDYIEEYNGKLYAYEFKWNPGSRTKFPKSFSKAYPGSETKAITTENYLEFITT